MKKKFPVYNQLNLPQINKEVLNEWEKEDLFSKSMTEREGAPSRSDILFAKRSFSSHSFRTSLFIWGRLS